MCTLQINAKSIAYARSDSSISFSACSRFVIVGKELGIVDTVDISDASIPRSIVLVGEFRGDSSSGGMGSGFSSMRECVSRALGKSVGVEGRSERSSDWSREKRSNNAEREATLRSVSSSFWSGVTVPIVSRFAYMFISVVNEATLRGEGRSGDRGGGGGGGYGGVRAGDDIDGEKSLGLSGGVLGFKSIETDREEGKGGAWIIPPMRRERGVLELVDEVGENVTGVTTFSITRTD